MAHGVLAWPNLPTDCYCSIRMIMEAVSFHTACAVIDECAHLSCWRRYACARERREPHVNLLGAALKGTTGLSQNVSPIMEPDGSVRSPKLTVGCSQ